MPIYYPDQKITEDNRGTPIHCEGLIRQKVICKLQMVNGIGDKLTICTYKHLVVYITPKKE